MGNPAFFLKRDRVASVHLLFPLPFQALNIGDHVKFKPEMEMTVSRTIRLAGLAPVLSGCQATSDPNNPNIYGSPFGQGIVGNKYSVIISKVLRRSPGFAGVAVIV